MRIDDAMPLCGIGQRYLTAFRKESGVFHLIAVLIAMTLNESFLSVCLSVFQYHGFHPGCRALSV